jgi:hypothetical protein
MAKCDWLRYLQMRETRQDGVGVLLSDLNKG